MTEQRRDRSPSVSHRCGPTLLAALAVWSLLPSGAAHACDRDGLAAIIDAPLPAKAGKSFNVADVDSTDGGEWEIYFGPDGRTPRTILRTDYGESGRTQARLTILSAGAYAVARKQSVYSVPYAVEGSTTIRETRDIYLFCDGRLVTPDKESWDGDAYEKAARETLATFDAAEIKPLLPALERK